MAACLPAAAAAQEFGLSIDVSRSAQGDQIYTTGPGSLFPGVDLTFAGPQSAFSYNLDLEFSSAAGFSDYLNNVLDQYNSDLPISDFEDFDYQDSCFQDASLSAFYDLPADTTYQHCDALDFSVTIHDVTLRVQAAEDATDVVVAIPNIDVYFESTGAEKRTDARRQFADYFTASGKSTELAMALLDQPADAILPVGMLPAEGSIFNASLDVSRSTLPADPMTGDPAQLAASTSLAFGFSSLQELIAYTVINQDATLADFGLEDPFYLDDCFTDVGGVIMGRCDAVNASFDFLGVQVIVTSPENDPNVRIEIPTIGYVYDSADAGLGDFISRSDVLADAEADLTASGAADDLFARLAQGVIAQRADDPLIGNPASLQGTFVRMALDMDASSSLLDEGDDALDARNRDQDPPGWMIGARGGTLTANRSEATYLEGVAERSGRLREGGRARWKISVPFTYLDYSNFSDPQSTGSVRASLELPLKPGRWVVEPTLGVGYVFETEQFSAGALYLGGVSSRFKIAPVGRGHIVIGNAVAHSSTIEIEGDGYFKTPTIENTTFRNGVAYQLPIGRRTNGGRLRTLRASYANTLITGDEVFLDSYNDVTLSYGIGSREASARNVAEMLRLGVSGSFGEDFESYTANVGYRF